MWRLALHPQTSVGGVPMTTNAARNCVAGAAVVAGPGGVRVSVLVGVGGGADRADRAVAAGRARGSGGPRRAGPHAWLAAATTGRADPRGPAGSTGHRVAAEGVAG